MVVCCHLEFKVLGDILSTGLSGDGLLTIMFLRKMVICYHCRWYFWVKGDLLSHEILGDGSLPIVFLSEGWFAVTWDSWRWLTVDCVSEILGDGSLLIVFLSERCWQFAISPDWRWIAASGFWFYEVGLSSFRLILILKVTCCPRDLFLTSFSVVRRLWFLCTFSLTDYFLSKAHHLPSESLQTSLVWCCH